MASANSMRLLMRPHLPIAPRVQHIVAGSAAATAGLSTTARANASNMGYYKKVQVPKKKKVVVNTRRPAPGERKAFRKRIQLSNNSALAVPGLPTLEAGKMADPESAGNIFALPADVQDRLRILEAFKPTQQWGLFRSPHVLLKKDVVDVLQLLESSVKDKKGARVVLTGEKLSGKSVALLQAMTYALLNDWVVINIPEGAHYPLFAQARLV